MSILRTFVTRLAPGDVACAQRAGPVFGYSRFPRRVRDVRTRVRRLAGDRSHVRDRRVAAAAAETLDDTAIHPSSGHGLRGGRCVVTPVKVLRLSRCRFVEDLAVSGTGRLDPDTNMLSAGLSLSGPGTARGALRLRPHGSNLVATGKLGHRRVHVLVAVRH